MSVSTTIETVRRRQAFLAAFGILQTLIACSLGLFIIWISMSRLLGIPGPTIGIAGWLAMVILAASGIAGWFRRPDPDRCAWLLDSALESQNLFGTLLDLPEDDSPVRSHLESQAESAVSSLHLPKAFPTICSRTGRWLWLPLTLLVASLFLPAKDPFGWRDQRIRQATRDRAVAAAEKTIDEELADSSLSPEARKMLQEIKEELATTLGEQEVAATLAQMAAAAAAMGDKEAIEAAENVLQEAAEAAGSESAVAAAASAAGPQDKPTGPEVANQDGAPSDSTKKPDGSDANSNAKTGEPGSEGDGAKPTQTADGSKSGEPGKPGDGDAAQASAGGDPSEGGSKPANGGKPGKPGDAQAGSTSGAGPGSGGIGDGGGQAATGGAGPVAFRDVMVEGKRVNDHTIEELIRIEDEEADNNAERRIFTRAKTAAAAHATATMSRTRIPSNAAASVRGYFEALAKPE